MALFRGVISHVLPEVSGVSKSGKQWRKRSYVLTYDSSNAAWPKAVVFDVMGDNIEKLDLREGEEYEVEVDFAAREWNGRWFLSAGAWKATRQAVSAPAAPAESGAGQGTADGKGDDLPF